jgi:hypothetical protein
MRSVGRTALSNAVSDALTGDSDALTGNSLANLVKKA